MSPTISSLSTSPSSSLHSPVLESIYAPMVESMTASAAAKREDMQPSKEQENANANRGGGEWAGGWFGSFDSESTSSAPCTPPNAGDVVAAEGDAANDKPEEGQVEEDMIALDERRRELGILGLELERIKEEREEDVKKASLLKVRHSSPRLVPFSRPTCTSLTSLC